MNYPALRAIVAVLCLTSGSVAAQNCGDTLTHSVRLAADLHCPNHAFALRIDTPGVVLDLGGHELSARSTSVLVEHAHQVAIVGPGVISGPGCRWGVSFHPAGVRALDSDLLEISGITFADVPIAVSAEGSSYARIHDNEVRQADFGFVLFDSPSRGRKAYGSEIANNAMYGSGNCGVQGAWVEGELTSGNVIVDNRFDTVTDGVFVAASRNWIGHNIHLGRSLPPYLGTFIGSGIYVAAGSGNHVLGNEISGVSVGVYLWPVHYDSRTGAMRLDATKNQIIGNRIVASDRGVLVGAGGPQTAGRAIANRIQENQLSADIGIWFAVNAFDNDGRGNAYPAVSVPVVDYGGGNRWP